MTSTSEHQTAASRALTGYVLALADDALIASHRLTEWIARAPQLEEDVALGNIALDLLGQARLLLQYAGTVSAKRDAVGTGRLEPTGKIGRVAVLPQYRGTGAGVAVMRRLVELAGGRGFTEVYLNAQTYARGFYERLGFRAEGPEFDEVGIPHQRMRRSVGNRDGRTAGQHGDAQHPVEPG